MKDSQRIPAFSLLELIIAAGLFAVAVTAVLALLPSLARQGGEAADALAAQRLPDALQAEFTRLGGTGFDALAAQLPVASGPLVNGLKFVADRDAVRLHSLDFQPPANGNLAADEQYFLVECWRFPEEPLAFGAGRGFLAAMVRVSWPYRVPGASAPVPAAARQEFVFTLALNR